MILSARSTLFTLGAVTVVLLAILVWAVRSSWLSSHHLQALHTKLAAEADDLSDNAQVLLTRMNSLLLASVFGPAAEHGALEDFEELAAELKLLLASEAFMSEDVGQAKRARRIIDEFDIYYHAAQSLIQQVLEGSDRNVRFERVEAVRTKGESILLDLYRVSQTSEQELEATFKNYHSAYNRLALLLILLPGLCIALAGATIFVALQNRVASLRLDLSRAKLAHAQQEKLAALGTLASGVAHEIRNPLTAIKTRLFALDRKMEPNPEARVQVVEIGNEINRLDRIVKEFLLFARPPKPNCDAIDIPPLLEQVASLFQSELESRGINIEIPRIEGLATRGDAEQIRQILINLIQNAADASESGSVITLIAKPVAGAGRHPQPQIAILVIDQGTGVPEEHAAKLFNPFYTAKAKGIGLGLSIAKRIAQIHGGDIIFESKEGEGTTFTLLLPAGSDAKLAEPASESKRLS